MIVRRYHDFISMLTRITLSRLCYNVTKLLLYLYHDFAMVLPPVCYAVTTTYLSLYRDLPITKTWLRRYTGFAVMFSLEKVDCSQR